MDGAGVAVGVVGSLGGTGVLVAEMRALHERGAGLWATLQALHTALCHAIFSVFYQTHPIAATLHVSLEMLVQAPCGLFMLNLLSLR